MPDPDDLEAVRAEGRRLLEVLADARNGIDGDRVGDAVEEWLNFTFAHADALLAPTLTEEEREAWSRTVFDALPWMEHEARCAAASDVTAAIIDRLSGSTSTGGPTEQRFPNGYPEDPVLGPYEDAAGGPSDG